MRHKISIGRNKLILFLVLVSAIILGYPLFVYGIDKSFFYSIDPDVVYITNTLLYIKYAIINYADHPGTPTMMLLNIIFIPLRLISKFFLHQNFIQWSYNNYAFLTYYARFFELLIFSAANLIFLKAVSKVSKSIFVLIFAWMSVFSFTGIKFAISIAPENFSFFLTSCWLLAFVTFLKFRKYSTNIFLVIISGLAVANKFTSIFLLIPSFFLPLLIKKLKIGKKLMMVSLNILISGLIFYLGILPAKAQFFYVKIWITSLITHAGSHGTGVQSVFDPLTYFGSLTNLIHNYPILFIFIGFTLGLYIYLVVKKKMSISDPIVVLITTGVLGVFVFAKYPIIHYNYVNLLLIIFSNIYLLSKARPLLTKISLIMISILFIFISTRYVSDVSHRLGSKQTETVDSILRAWTPFWSADIFREQFEAADAIKP